MKFYEFRSSLPRALSTQRRWWIGGPDLFLRGEGLRGLRQHLPAGIRAVSLAPDEVTLEAVESALTNLSLFGETPVLCLTDIQSVREPLRSDVLDQCAQSPKDVIVIITCDESPTKMGPPAGWALVECWSPWNDADAGRLVQEAARQRGLQFSTEGLSAFMDRIDELADASTEFDKLLLAVSPQGPASSPQTTVVNETLVATYVGNTDQPDAFEVMRAIIQHDAGKALQLVGHCWAHGEDPVAITSHMAWYLQKALAAKSLRSRGVPWPSIYPTVKMWKDRDGFMRDVERMQPEDGLRWLAGLLTLDALIKRGDPVPQAAVEQWVWDAVGIKTLSSAPQGARRTVTISP